MSKGLISEWSFPFTVSFGSTIFQLTGLDLVLRYSRQNISDGDWWLFLTGNLVHLGWGHLLLNIAGLLMVWWFFVRDLRQWEWIFIFLVSALFVTVGIYWLNSYIIWYVGLSGLLHGLFIAGGLRLLSNATERNFALLLLAVIVVKLGYEQFYGSLPGTAEMSGGPVVVDAHFYGAIGGVFAYALLFSLQKSGMIKSQ